MDEPVLYRLEGDVAVLTLNRPEKRNAMNQALLARLYDHLEAAAKEPAARTVVITGAGDSFCAGLDLSVITTDNLMDPRGDGRGLMEVLGELDKPLIGAVNGHAITGGFELALNCDLLIASEKAYFRDTHARVGIHPGWGMSQLLRQAVGARRARQMSLGCEPIYAETALAWGLVNEVVPSENLLPRVFEIAASISKGNPEMVRTMKRLIGQGENLAFGEALDLEKKGFLDFLGGAGMLKG